MKINKKKAVDWTIGAVVLFGSVDLGVCATVLRTNNINSYVVCLLVILTVVVAIGALVAAFLAIVDASSSDEVKEEFVKQLEVRKSRDASQYIAVVSNHGNNLKDVMEAIRHEEWEYYAFFNLSGQKLAEGTYQSPKTCNITKEDWQRLKQCKEEVIGLHNHPGTYNGSFSKEDFAAFLQYDFIRQFIVVTEKYNYVLKKTANGYEKFYDEARTYAGEMFTKYLWLEVLSGRLWTVLVSLKTAKRFGLEFCIERVPRPATQKNAFRIGLATCAILAFCLAGYRPLPESSPLSPAPTVTATAVASSTKTGSTPVVDIYDDAHAISGSIDCPSGKDPANDPCFQGNAPVGGGPNYN